MSTHPGCLIVFEGLDGSGTTTQAARLAQALREEGREVLSTREPSDGPIGKLIREALAGRLTLPGGHPLAKETLALLYAADRTDHLHATVWPALRAGRVVISERYLLSSLAYQGAELPRHGAWLKAINDFAPPPDLTIFLRVTPEEASRRRAARGLPLELFEDEAVQRRVAAEYERAIGRLYDAWHIVMLDGPRPPEAVAADVLAAAHEVLRHG